jgi:signal transduction histidine kinase/ligand-binding sensor domain-containing protein/CheY-like chemotaxis protein
MYHLKSIRLARVALPACAHMAFRLVLTSLVLAQSITLQAQISATNRVLELDGNGSYVELPPNIFNDLTEATVEGWVMWERIGKWSRFYGYGDEFRSLTIVNRENSSDLRFQLFPDGHDVLATEVMQSNRWIHVAAVSGRGGMKFFVNGVLFGTNSFTGSFKSTGSGRFHYLGKSEWGLENQDDLFVGKMDEVRVWRVARTADQIRDNLFRTMLGNEPGLVALWNFENVENGLVKDSGPGGHHGKLKGQAKTVAAALPLPNERRTEKVLQLSGAGSYVELPPDIFNDLNESTVEAWVRWDEFGELKRVFNYGDRLRDLSLTIAGSEPILVFFIGDATNGLQTLPYRAPIKLHNWHHIAGVSGPGGMRLFLDGVMVATNSYTGSFSALRNGIRHYLGQRVTEEDAPTSFVGQMDEIRVWKTTRTEKEIRETLFSRLSGSETGLVGYWNFDDGTARDASPGGHHGKLQGNATVLATNRPTGPTFDIPAIVTGTLTDSQGRPQGNAEVRLLRNGSQVARTNSTITGEYRLVFAKPDDEPYLLEATKGELGERVDGLQLFHVGTVKRDLSLFEAPSLSGRLLSSNGLPRIGVRIEAVSAGTIESPSAGQTLATTLSQADGRFRFNRLTPGSYRVRAATAAGPTDFDGGRKLELMERTAAAAIEFRLPETSSTSIPRPAASQPNGVLQLGGGEGFAELPSNILNSLEEATVEGWVRWDRLTFWARFFDFGRETRTMVVGVEETSPALRLELFDAQSRRRADLRAPGIVETNRWIHVAAVTGPGGARLYVNGILAESSDYTGSFAGYASGEHNFLGRNNWREVDPKVKADMTGRMEEIRIWALARTAEQIRDGMYQQVRGDEAGLVAAWNFEGGAARDLTPNGFHLKLHGDARIVEETFPDRAQTRPYLALFGKVVNEKEGPLPGAAVTLERDGLLPRTATANLRGEYRLLVEPSELPCRLTATHGTLQMIVTNLVISASDTNVNLTLREFAQISGRIAAFDGTPLEAVVVQAVQQFEGTLLEASGGFEAEFFAMDTPPKDYPEIPVSRPPTFQTNQLRVNVPLQLADEPFVPGSRLRDNFFARWTGKFTVPESGEYIFALRSDDGSRLFIDGSLVVDNGGVHYFVWKTGTTNLSSGEHDLKLEYFNGAGGRGCQLFWSGAKSTNSVRQLLTITESTTTDRKGEYRITGLTTGPYQVRCHVPGKHVYAGEGSRFRVQQDKAIPDVNFKIAPFKKGQWKTYTRTDGLGHDQVYVIHETPEGMMWFGTHSGGISRWDGRRFKNYTKADGLLSDVVSEIASDATGGIWSTDFEGNLTRWQGQKAVRIGETNGLPSDEVFSVKRGNDGTVWIATGRGLAHWDGNRFETFSTTNGLPKDRVIDLHPARDGRVWISTSGGLTVKDGTNFVTYTLADGLPDITVFAIDEAPNGDIWFMTPLGLARRNATGFQLVSWYEGLPSLLRGIPQTTFLALKVDNRGNVWLGTYDEGVWRWDGTSFINYRTADGLAMDRVHAINQDQDGVMWFGTFSGGVSRLTTDRFTRYSEADGLPSSHVHSLFEDRDGSLWIGTESGASKWHGQAFTNLTTANGLIDNAVKVIVRDRAGVLWFGTHGGISRWDGRRFENFTTADGLGHNYILCASVTADGSLWFGTVNGAARWDGRRFDNVTTADGLPNNTITAITEDKSGNTWFGTDNGLSRWDGLRFKTFTKADGLPGPEVTALSAPAKGRLWIGQDVVGLAQWNGERFFNYTPADGLGASFVESMAIDSSGVLWLGHNKNISLFDGAAWSSFEPDDGFADARTSRSRACILARDGSMWIGTSGGLFHYSGGKPPKHRPTITVKADRDYADVSRMPAQTTGSRLTFNLNMVDHLTRPEKQQFRYQAIPGTASPEQLAHSRNWSKPVKAIEIDWTTNAPGTYTFAVQYINQDLRYSEPAVATITLVLPWYRNAKLMVPLAVLNFALVGWAVAARSLYMRKRREAERLREQLFEEEHRAREAAEKARAEIEGTNAELAKAKAAADQASQAKSQFLASMSHELRTPLTAIIGFSEMLMGEARSNGAAEQVEDLTRINDSANHLLGLINGILDLSKIEAQKMELHLENFDIALFLHDVTHTIRPLVDRKGNELIVECPTDIGSMRTDLVKVRQCLFNLLGNANKFTEKGTITLSVSKAEAQRLKAKPGPGANDVEERFQPSAFSLVNFQVTDTGIGMTREQMDRLFQAFSQADASTARKYGGTGLGLTITKRFCEMLGGSIRVESELGKGSCFTMELPVLAPAPKTDLYRATSAAMPAAAANGKGVLVIDDDPNVHRLIERTLKDEGIALWFASNAEEGLRLARELRPAAITLDVMMPGTDGWSVLSSLKSDPELAKIPVVMLTISSETEIGFALGASEYLVKPIDRNLLILTLKRYLTDGSPGRVLIVEDDRSLRDLLRRMLETEKWTVDDAENGVAAMEKIQARVPSVILLDLMMPVMDGFQVLAELHKHDDWRKIPVVVITAMDLTQADRARLKQQTEKIFEKGTRLQQELLREVRTCLDQYRDKHYGQNTHH